MIGPFLIKMEFRARGLLHTPSRGFLCLFWLEFASLIMHMLMFLPLRTLYSELLLLMAASFLFSPLFFHSARRAISQYLVKSYRHMCVTRVLWRIQMPMARNYHLFGEFVFVCCMCMSYGLHL